MKKSAALRYAADAEMQGLPRPVLEHTFHPVRRWRFDFSWPRQRVALEVEGGVFMGPETGHRSIAGMKRDIEKYNEAARYGWFVLRVTPDRLYHAETHQLVRDVLTNRGWRPGAKAQAGPANP